MIDNGSGVCKCGFAVDTAPQLIFPSILGRPKYNREPVEYLFGDQAQKSRGILRLKYPIQGGVIVEWNDMEKLWAHTFYKLLEVNPQDYGVLLSEAPMNPAFNREKMIQIMFEVFGVRAFYVTTNSLLRLYSSGLTTGMVLDSGDGVTYAQPIYKGHVVPGATVRSDLAGSALTDYLIDLLRLQGINFTTSAEREIAREIKEKVCYVAEDFQLEVGKAKESLINDKFYILPDGQVIALNQERCRCPEALFKPQLVGSESLSIDQIVHKAIEKAGSELGCNMYSNILLSGGTTMCPGFSRRLEKALEQSGQCLPRLNVIAPPNRNVSAWIGGAVLAGLSTFHDMWITKQEYEDVGLSIVHRDYF